MTAALVFALLALVAPPAEAQTTYTVTLNRMTADSTVDDPAPDGCAAADCSLREAVLDANANPGADIITFEGPGTISLDRTGAESDTTNDLDITDDVTILGVGDSTSITPADMNFSEERVFDIVDSTVVIENIVFFDSEGNGDGGAIRADFGSDLTVRDSTFRNNQSYFGGAIAQNGGDLLVEDSLFAGNNANFQGGAIYVLEPESHQIENTLFEANSAGVYCCSSAGSAGEGGAIYYNYDASPAPALINDSTFVGNFAQTAFEGGGNFPGGIAGAIYSSNAPLAITNTVFDSNGSENTTLAGAIYMTQFEEANASTIDNTTFVRNQAIQNGGAIQMVSDDFNGVDLTISESTFDRNFLTGDDGSAGGAIYVGWAESDLDITNSTISANTAVLGGGIHIEADQIPQRQAVAQGQFNFADVRLGHVTLVENEGRAGIVSQSANATVESRSTIVADNVAANCSAPNPGVFVSLDYNLESRDECNFDQANDQTDTDPTLGPLADNNGQTQGQVDTTGIGQTHALLDGSPAIDAADPDFCPDPIGTDQRLVTRPQGPACDVGAYEAGDTDVAVDKSVSPMEVDTETDSTFTITVTNPAPSQPADVVVTDEVPAGLIINDVMTTQGTCDPPAGQTITCDLGTVAVDATVTITIDVSGPVPGSYTNTATIDVNEGAGDDNPENDSADATLVVVEDQVLCSGGEDENGDPIIVDGINRIEGLNRIQTAIAASQAACGDGEAPAVVLTRADLFPDAQAVAPFAIDIGAPLLLSNPATLDAETETEIQRVLLPGGTVYLSGGEVALSAAVNQRLIDLGYNTVRYGGVNRFETAAIIADQGLNNPPNLLIADGGDFADSIVAGAASVNVDTTSDTVQAAVLLTSDVNIPPETQAYLDSRVGPAPTLIAIGVAAGQAFPAAEEVSGPTRFETAVAVAERFFDRPRAFAVARSNDFADGLTGASLIGRTIVGPGPMLLVETDSLPSAVDTYLQANASDIERALIFGGTAAIDASVEAAIETALGL
ncbi:cell wall-binding repeat-containing protein [Euzebya tangerina]|uniref:cell wall-binding repeat-containing protein n=1 Tax=Euzebya tangerina TaxID=591198 RepID=UPI000E3114B7|nr:cell wall-binding repeat-containing protein [Euzebya tangerina]